MNKFSSLPIAIFALFVFHFVAPCATAETTESLYTRGVDFVNSGNLNEAMPLLERVEQQSRDYKSVRSYLIKTYRFLGVQYYSDNRHQDAISIWQKALKLDPHNREIQNYVVRCKQELDALDKMKGITRDSVVSRVEPAPIASLPEDMVVPRVIDDSKVKIERLPVVVQPEPSKIRLVPGIQIGLNIPAGNVELKRKIGLLVLAHVSLHRHDSRFGLRFDLMHKSSTQTAVGQDGNGTGLNSTMFGLGIHGTAQLKEIRLDSIYALAGFGLYGSSQHRYSKSTMEGRFTSETKLGYTLGLGWERSIAGLNSNVELRYFLPTSSISASAFQLVLGIDFK